MSPANDLFRMVSLREPISTSKEVTAGIRQTELYKTLDALIPNLQALNVVDKAGATLRNKVAEIINKQHQIMTDDDARDSIVAALAEAIHNLQECTLTTLADVKVTWQRKELGLQDLVDSDDFKTHMARLSDTWLSIHLGTTINKKSELVNLNHAVNITVVENLLRAGWLAQRYVEAPSTLAQPGACDTILERRISYPRKWQSEYTPSGAPGEKKARICNLDQLKKRNEILTRQIRDLEKIQIKVTKAYGKLLDKAMEKQSLEKQAKSSREKASRRAMPSGVSQKDGSTQIPIVRGQDLRKELQSMLYSSELTTLEEHKLTVESKPFTPEPYQSRLNQILEDLYQQAADNCSKIHVWEDEITRQDTRTPAEPVTDTNRPAVRAIGFGDLIVARERLIGYEANEIAHIENVLPKEERLREHEIITKREELTETETLTEKSSEKDLETTDRNELQTQTQKAIKQQFSINAGLNTSGKYGLTTVGTSLQAGFSYSAEESRNTTSNISKEIVSKAVESTRESTRELRRVTISEQVRELNRHGIKELEKPFSGVYYWVEKIHEVELRHYGTRLMVEFYIPEPGLSLLPENNTATSTFKKPAPLTLRPQDINPPHHLCLAALYSANDIEQPPPPTVQVGYHFATTPTEGKESGDVAGGLIKIPVGYVPITATVKVSTEWFGDPVNVFVNIGGKCIISGNAPQALVTDMELDAIPPTAEGIPISILVVGHQDRAATFNVQVKCCRTEDAVPVRFI